MRLGMRYDASAPSFDRFRSLPSGVPEAVRASILAAIEAASRPRILDLGAGTGRIGRAFVAADDDYVGVDLSLGMLSEFVRHWRHDTGGAPRLVQADGERLPFPAATFDAVLLIQVIGAARDWRAFVAEPRRVMRPAGALILGHAVTPPEGVDARMKRQLRTLLEEAGQPSYHMDTRGVVQPWLERKARESSRITAAEWIAQRSPRAFLERQPTGARFAALPAAVQEEALRQLTAWATETFGSLDSRFEERHAFELQVFRFGEGADR